MIRTSQVQYLLVYNNCGGYNFETHSTPKIPEGVKKEFHIEKPNFKLLLFVIVTN